ncbi:hypothetical protein [Jiangella aurantiaca]|uniref:hypothetical protein n=1 Tax=Jiangella aurantiaca TaxID=2530373 RepID=UPI0013A5E6C1|nr:hypothetical protein [Jiangella aurantiaca]
MGVGVRVGLGVGVGVGVGVAVAVAGGVDGVRVGSLPPELELELDGPTSTGSPKSSPVDGAASSAPTPKIPAATTARAVIVKVAADFMESIVGSPHEATMRHG